MHTILQLLIGSAVIVCVSSFSCYLCNSLTKEDCIENYEKYLAPCPVKSFGGMKSIKAIGCRVTQQYVNDEYSLVRDCAYSGDDVESKTNKGSMGVRRIYTQCSDKPACNPSASLYSLPIIAISLAFVARYL